MGTVTDIEGAFKLEVPAEGGIMLVFSFIGMETKEIKADTSFMKVVLKESVEQVDEVVVTGYQKIDKRVLSSSVASIKGEDLIGGNAISVDQMLQGRLAGGCFKPNLNTGCSSKNPDQGIIFYHGKSGAGMGGRWYCAG